MDDPLTPGEIGVATTPSARLEFETLLADLSARFVNLPADRVDLEIGEAQRRLCAFFGLDRSTLWQSAPDDPNTVLLTHLHQPPEVPKPPDRMDCREFFPWASRELHAGKALAIRSLSALPPEASRDREVFAHYGTKSALIFPLSAGGGAVFGFLSFAEVRSESDWPAEVVTRCRVVAEVLASALARKRSEERLRLALEELSRLREQLRHEVVHLRTEVQALQGRTPIVGDSEPIRQVLEQARQVAAAGSTVLILGETGTGKELLAAHLHRIGSRSAQPFISTNIAAIPGTLLESELFGREKGAYTGALCSQIGRFEMADGGTLLLDEVGEMPLETQAKLLRVIQSGEFERLGSGRTLKVDVHLIAATNRKLPELVREGKFRRDLYYRLNVFPITLPPLRDRPEDIPALVWSFVQELAERMGKPVERIRKEDLDALRGHEWPGNVRELRNLVERSMILARGPELRLVMPEGQPGSPAEGSRALRDVERAHVEKVLRSAGGRIYGPGGAAQVLGLKPTTLYALMGRLGINRRK